MEKMFTFVLKDKGTNNEGWWLKISNAEELANYYEKDNRGTKVISEYMNQDKHKGKLTEAIEAYSANRKMTIWQGYSSFTQEVAMKQLEYIDKYGAIYINRVGGYHNAYGESIEYDTTIRNSLTFPKDGEVVDSVEIKKCEKIKDEKYGFISPSAEFYEGKWSTHSELAREIIKSNDWIVDDVYGQNVAINYLIIERGFILVHNPSMIEDCFVVGEENATKEQREFLYHYFLDNGNKWRADEYK